MNYTTHDNTILSSITGEIVEYTCITDIADGIYESYESSVINNALVIIKIIRTVENYVTKYEITELTEQEILNYLETIKPPLSEPKPFDWEDYERKLNKIQESWFLNIITNKPYEYTSFYELSLWTEHPNYGDEAKMFIELWWSSWSVLKQHLQTVNEETANINNFITQLNQLYGNQ